MEGSILEKYRGFSKIKRTEIELLLNRHGLQVDSLELGGPLYKIPKADR